MTEYREGDKVWVAAIVAHPAGTGAYVRLDCGAGDGWMQVSAMRPRIPCTLPDGQEPVAPEGDVAKLRAACEAALQWMADWGVTAPNVEMTLRAALAEAPSVEGPVRVGDRVSIEGTVVAEMTEGRVAIMLDVPTTVIAPRCMLTIVSRPAPAETCGGCRWFQPSTQYQQCRKANGWPYAGPDTPACARFERYAGK